MDMKDLKSAIEFIRNHHDPDSVHTIRYPVPRRVAIPRHLTETDQVLLDWPQDFDERIVTSGRLAHELAKQLHKAERQVEQLRLDLHDTLTLALYSACQKDLEQIQSVYRRHFGGKS